MTQSAETPCQQDRPRVGPSIYTSPISLPIQHGGLQATYLMTSASASRAACTPCPAYTAAMTVPQPQEAALTRRAYIQKSHSLYIPYLSHSGAVCSGLLHTHGTCTCSLGRRSRLQCVESVMSGVAGALSETRCFATCSTEQHSSSILQLLCLLAHPARFSRSDEPVCQDLRTRHTG